MKKELQKDSYHIIVIASIVYFIEKREKTGSSSCYHHQQYIFAIKMFQIFPEFIYYTRFHII